MLRRAVASVLVVSVMTVALSLGTVRRAHAASVWLDKLILPVIAGIILMEVSAHRGVIEAVVMQEARRKLGWLSWWLDENAFARANQTMCDLVHAGNARAIVGANSLTATPEEVDQMARDLEAYCTPPIDPYAGEPI